MGVLVSVEDGGSSSSNTNTGNTTNDDGSGLPGGPGVLDDDGSLLGAVGEVVVTGAHVVVVSKVGHLDESSVEIGSGGRVELVAVLVVLLYLSGIVVVLGVKVTHVEAVNLIDHGHTGADSDVLEESIAAVEIGVLHGVVAGHVSNLDDVVAVSGGLSLTSVTSGVGVATSPLEVDVVVLVDLEVSGDEVVLSGGVALHDVSSLSTDVQVVDLGSGGDSAGTGDDAEHVAAVLEDTSGLSSVQSEGEVVSRGGDGGVVLDGGVVGVVAGVHVEGDLTDSDVVTDTEDTSAGRGGFHASLVAWDGPVVVSSVSVDGVSKVVVTGPGGLLAVRLADSPGWDGGPCTSSLSAVSLVVGSHLSISSVAEVLGHDVLGLSLVQSTVVLVVGHDHDILPWRGVPVGVVVMLLSALKSIAGGSGVLAGGHSSIVVAGVLVSSEQSLVTASLGASRVVGVGLVHSVLKVGAILEVGVLVVEVVGSRGIGGTSGDGVGGQTITDNLHIH